MKVLQDVWDAMQPWALHPLQRAGLDESLRLILNHTGRADLLDRWAAMYG